MESLNDLVRIYLSNVPRDGKFHVRDSHPGCIFHDGFMAYQIMPTVPNQKAVDGMAAALVLLLNKSTKE